jgi:hypothetical protein
MAAAPLALSPRLAEAALVLCFTILLIQLLPAGASIVPKIGVPKQANTTLQLGLPIIKVFNKPTPAAAAAAAQQGGTGPKAAVPSRAAFRAVCGSQEYDSNFSICCAGRLTSRMGDENACCGDTPFNTSGGKCCPPTVAGSWRVIPRGGIC